jgi:hypothetical protein
MARIGSGDSFDIGIWQKRDNAGAGSTSFSVFTGKGLNDNFIRLWRAIKTVLNADGTMASAVVDCTNLKSTVPDDSTLEQDAGTKKLKIKALGVDTAQLKDDAVSTAKIADDAITSALIADNAVLTAHVADGNITHVKLAADAVESDNISHDNTRTKVCFSIGFASDASGVFGYVANQIMTSTYGIPMPRAGSITRLTACDTAGNVTYASYNYGTKVFSAYDKIQVKMTDDATVGVLKNNNILIDGNPDGVGVGTTASMVILECEFDD